MGFRCHLSLIWCSFVVVAMELALSLEKLVNEKLLNLHSVRQSLFRIQFLFYGFQVMIIFLIQLGIWIIWWIGGFQERWCPVGRFYWERVFERTGKIKIRPSRSMLVAKIWGFWFSKWDLMILKISLLRRWKQLRKSQDMFLNLEESAKDMVTICFISFKLINHIP